MTVSVGDKVWFVPSAKDFGFDTDRDGKELFEHIFLEDGQGQHRHKKGDRVHLPNLQPIPVPGTDKFVKFLRDDKGVLRTREGHAIGHGRPLRFWPAVVREVHPDGSVDLDISHPNSYETHHIPDRPAVRARNASLQRDLDREAAAHAAGTECRYERAGVPCDRETWRAWVQGMIRDADDLKAVPSIPHDPAKGQHTYHCEGE